MNKRHCHVTNSAYLDTAMDWWYHPMLIKWNVHFLIISEVVL